MSQGKCKSCGADVFFAKTIAGKNGIWDSQWANGGTGFEMTPDGARHIKDAPSSTRVYTSHWATCPNAKEHREGGLFGHPPAHHNAPETSHDAADAIAPDAATLRKRVLEYIASKPNGATDDEIQIALGLKGNTQTPRRWELERAGLVRDSGLRRQTQTGRMAVVWMVKE